jgi:Alpha amylase, C-terminal all-beta domain
VHNGSRVIAFHRWVPGAGYDVVVVASLNEYTFYDQGYQLGFPVSGHWDEVFNSDIYENWFNRSIRIRKETTAVSQPMGPGFTASRNPLALRSQPMAFWCSQKRVYKAG